MVMKTQCQELGWDFQFVSILREFREKIHFSRLPVTHWLRQGATQSGSLRCVVFLRACCVGNSRVSKRACYWQLSPSPWAGGAACCVGRGYTCSGPARPRCRCTFRLRPAPNCRSASPPLGWGTEPVESERIRLLLRTSTETGCLCLLLFIIVATQQNLLKQWCRQEQFTLTSSIQILWNEYIMWPAVPVLSL